MPSPSAISAIHRAILAVPRGRVASYGAIAACAGLPGRARMVGKLLASTPDGVELPWHRILRADGRIAFPVGSDAHREQVQRLRSEGIDVREGRVDLRRHGMVIEADLDSALWGPRP